ncbi:hypothetical protein Nm8I071_30590 [Nonomuraea sp. TT08I-71]|nr:hypothetical protein Nm8I071_30590 [Nonomuraea sp. TT08I-71]
MRAGEIRSASRLETVAVWDSATAPTPPPASTSTVIPSIMTLSRRLVVIRAPRSAVTVVDAAAELLTAAQ